MAALPAGVLDIGGFTFAACHALSGVTINGSVTNIGRMAFVNCEALADHNFQHFLRKIIFLKKSG